MQWQSSLSIVPHFMMAPVCSAIIDLTIKVVINSLLGQSLSQILTFLFLYWYSAIVQETPYKMACVTESCAFVSLTWCPVQRPRTER
ncbi:hypothetical protein V1520DRAFT_371179 [Lipomyces starkeyi]|uniref:Uncharacterized protein n=1 Tax=Lipomyces starkeyi NRRL Y-11557 TaxID=675824 RepID=A0A1E3Q040_LIPST|nr:hypothetical protein LIPSTDRAFT_146304 [Lipomyces starkeyi NRRL Y-11557]